MRPLALGLLVLWGSFAPAQDLETYLRLRKQHGIVQAADADALAAFVGKRVFEIRGTVRGIVKGSDGELLILDSAESGQHFVRAQSAPEWLRHGAVPARMIVRAQRESETGPLNAELLGAAPESDVAARERKAAPKPKVASSSGSTTSRSGRRPPSMPGNLPSVQDPVVEPRSQISPRLAEIHPSYARFIRRHNPKLSAAMADRIAENILLYSAHFGVDPRLIMAIVMTESDFRPETTSHKGAMGLGQLMPVNVKELGLSNGYDIDQNLYGTVKLVRGHLEKYNSRTGDSFEALVLALAGYNAGDGAVKRHGGVPPYRETQNYVKKVIERYAQLTGR
ncbi:MAG: lytic transglycosylase domain-containing protein [Fimbriimonadaceae bacterium]|nr:lytic transglycosylase domain-containing protein [Fimbriimonadaceae bacterium]QYK57723.1 MAG: lytic transglycosylase domain-containing protein [Fimbriimonadaceae bacterium]